MSVRACTAVAGCCPPKKVKAKKDVKPKKRVPMKKTQNKTAYYKGNTRFPHYIGNNNFQYVHNIVTNGIVNCAHNNIVVFVTCPKKPFSVINNSFHYGIWKCFFQHISARTVLSYKLKFSNYKNTFV